MANNLKTRLARLRREGQITLAEYKTLSDMLEGQEMALRGSGMWITRYYSLDVFGFMCNQCGREVIETSKFCPNCGKPMKWEGWR